MHQVSLAGVFHQGCRMLKQGVHLLLEFPAAFQELSRLKFHGQAQNALAELWHLGWLQASQVWLSAYVKATLFV